MENDKVHPSDKSYTLYNEGVFALENGNLDDAYQFFQASLKLDEHFKTYERLYEVSVALGKSEESVHFLEKAYQLNPQNDKTAILYAKMMILTGKLEQAKLILDSILARNQTYGPARKLLTSLKP